MKKRKRKPLQSSSNIHAQVGAPVPVEHAKVWAKIADRRVTQKNEPPSPAPPVDGLQNLFPSPRTTLFIVVMVVSAGFCGGWLHGHSDKIRLTGKLQSDYISSILPYSPSMESPR